MKCTKCEKQIDFVPPVFRNLETYGGSAVAISRCCGIAYSVKIKHSYDIQEYTGTSNIDDWGNKIKVKENG